MPNWSDLNVLGSGGRACDGWRGSGLRRAPRPASTRSYARGVGKSGEPDALLTLDVTGEPRPFNYYVVAEYELIPADSARPGGILLPSMRTEHQICPYQFRYGETWRWVRAFDPPSAAIVAVLFGYGGVEDTDDPGAVPPQSDVGATWERQPAGDHEITEGLVAGTDTVTHRGWCPRLKAGESATSDASGTYDLLGAILAAFNGELSTTARVAGLANVDDLHEAGRFDALERRRTRDEHGPTCAVRACVAADPAFPDYDTTTIDRVIEGRMADTDPVSDVYSEVGYDRNGPDGTARYLPECTCDRAARRAQWAIWMRHKLRANAARGKVDELKESRRHA